MFISLITLGYNTPLTRRLLKILNCSLQNSFYATARGQHTDQHHNFLATLLFYAVKETWQLPPFYGHSRAISEGSSHPKISSKFPPFFSHWYSSYYYGIMWITQYPPVHPNLPTSSSIPRPPPSLYPSWQSMAHPQLIPSPPLIPTRSSNEPPWSP